jgi:hypothetical protein
MRAVTGCIWSQIYSDADRGVPGPISRIWADRYTQHNSCVERFLLKQGEAELDRFLQPEGHVSAV